MANREQLNVLRKGLSAWTKWRKANPLVILDLAGAALRGADLFHVELQGADLSNSDLSKADLSCANLSLANLAGANLQDADLGSAQLAGSRLTEANLAQTDLSRANLTGAGLIRTDLTAAHLDESLLARANFSEARLERTRFLEARLYRTGFAFTSLRTAQNLESCLHYGPSSIDLDTLMDSGSLPEPFLRGCGLAEEFLRAMPQWQHLKSQAGPCLISYSYADALFAQRLHDALQAQGLRCWLDEHPVLPADAAGHPLGEAVHVGEKLLLCCSHASLQSWWVAPQVEQALRLEERLSRELGRPFQTLIPLNLDGFLFRPDWQDWPQEPLTSRPIADFSDWDTNPARFGAQLKTVVQALRAKANPQA